MAKARAIDQLAGLPSWPLGLTEAQAAVYVGLSIARFRRAVACGRLPPPEVIEASVLWSRVALERAFSRLAPAILHEPDHDPVAAAISAEIAAREKRAQEDKAAAGRNRAGAS